LMLANSNLPREGNYICCYRDRVSRVDKSQVLDEMELARIVPAE